MVGARLVRVQTDRGRAAQATSLFVAVVPVVSADVDDVSCRRRGVGPEPSGSVVKLNASGAAVATCRTP